MTHDPNFPIRMIGLLCCLTAVVTLGILWRRFRVALGRLPQLRLLVLSSMVLFAAFGYGFVEAATRQVDGGPRTYVIIGAVLLFATSTVGLVRHKLSRAELIVLFEVEHLPSEALAPPPPLPERRT